MHLHSVKCELAQSTKFWNNNVKVTGSTRCTRPDTASQVLAPLSGPHRNVEQDERSDTLETLSKAKRCGRDPRLNAGALSGTSLATPGFVRNSDFVPRCRDGV